MDLQLYYDSVFVGDIADIFCDQGTWYGTFVESSREAKVVPQQCIRDFILFCRAWNARCDASQDPDPDEFDLFSELLKSRLWFLKAEDGSRTEIDGAPNFYGEEICWRLPEDV